MLTSQIIFFYGNWQVKTSIEFLVNIIMATIGDDSQVINSYGCRSWICIVGVAGQV